MENKHLQIHLVIFLIFFAAVTSVVLFPIISEHQFTFSQIRQNKEETMKTYQNDWSDYTIVHSSDITKSYTYGDQIATITIPNMDIFEYPVYYGSDPVSNNWQITSPGHVGNWSLFGEPGVTCVGAHNYQLFKSLHKLKPGDKILVETYIDRYVYIVDEMAIYHDGQDVWNTVATKHKTPYALNLMTCYPFDAVKTNDMYIVYTSLQKGTVFK